MRDDSNLSSPKVAFQRTYLDVTGLVTQRVPQGELRCYCKPEMIRSNHL